MILNYFGEVNYDSNVFSIFFSWPIITNNGKGKNNKKRGILSNNISKSKIQCKKFNQIIKIKCSKKIAWFSVSWTKPRNRPYKAIIEAKWSNTGRGMNLEKCLNPYGTFARTQQLGSC